MAELNNTPPNPENHIDQPLAPVTPLRRPEIEHKILEFEADDLRAQHEHLIELVMAGEDVPEADEQIATLGELRRQVQADLDELDERITRNHPSGYQRDK